MYAHDAWSRAEELAEAAPGFNRRHHEADDSITYADIAMLKKGGLAQPLLEEDPVDDPFMWVRLIATVTAVSLGSSLQFGFATGSLNNLEQVCGACNFYLSLSHSHNLYSLHAHISHVSIFYSHRSFLRRSPTSATRSTSPRGPSSTRASRSAA